MWLAHHITSSLISIGPAQSCTVTVKGVLVELEGCTPKIKGCARKIRRMYS